MNAKDYWGTTKRLDTQYRSEAEKAVAAHDERQKEAAREEAKARNERLARRDQLLAHAWAELKPGDTMMGGRIVILKKNKCSIVSANGNRYTIAELFGSQVERIVREKMLEVTGP